MKGDLFCLELIRWGLFTSCTVSRRGASDRYLRRLFFALKYQIARYQGVPVDRLTWALRIESGTDPEHRHLHFLMGGLRSCTATERFRIMYAWERLVAGHCCSESSLLRGWNRQVEATCRCRLYEPARGAAGYLADVLNASEYQGWEQGYVEFSHSAISEARSRRQGVAA